MDTTFTCNKCGQHIVIDAAGAGQLVDCPKCGTPLEVPYKSGVPTATPPSQPASSAPPPTTQPDTKKCPFCAEKIQTGVKACRFCGYNLVTGKPPTRITETATARPSSTLSKILAVVAIIGAVAIIVLAVWLFQVHQRTRDLQKSLADTQDSLRVTQHSLKVTQQSLADTQDSLKRVAQVVDAQSALLSSISRKLDAVASLAENANRHAHSHY